MENQTSGLEKVSILHIISDKKFIESCAKTFDLPFLANHYLPTLEGNEKYLESNGIQILIIHYLKFKDSKVLNTRNFQIPIVWFFWGADGFKLGKFHNKFLLPKTASLQLELSFRTSFFSGIKELAKRLSYKFIDLRASSKSQINALKRIHTIVPIMPADFDILRNAYPVSSKFFHLNYITPVFFSQCQTVEGNNILLGNSSSYTNNHIEALDILATFNLNGRKIFIPLSYGDKAYGKFVKGYAEKILPNNVECIQNFMSFENYSEIMTSCEIVIMNHLRQQGLGNIILALYSGAALYLRKESSIFKYLVKHQFTVFEFNESVKLQALDKSLQNRNKELCVDLFGPSLQKQRVKELILSITNGL